MYGMLVVINMNQEMCFIAPKFNTFRAIYADVCVSNRASNVHRRIIAL